jgi:transcriptional/translational regulatory protein YebC/TACO1
MSGHSEWSTINRKKGALNVKYSPLKINGFLNYLCTEI